MHDGRHIKVKDDPEGLVGVHVFVIVQRLEAVTRTLNHVLIDLLELGLVAKIVVAAAFFAKYGSDCELAVQLG